MARVEAWAKRNGAEYILVEDEEFIRRPPKWVHRKCGQRINPVTDLARLIVAAELLETAGCVVWLDADFLILEPERLGFPQPSDAAFAREIWVDAAPDGTIVTRRNIANYVCAFRRGGQFLPRYYKRAVALLETVTPPLKIGVVGTTFLTHHAAGDTVELLRHLGNFSPSLASALLAGERSPLIDSCERALSEEILGTVLGCCLSRPPSNDARTNLALELWCTRRRHLAGCADPSERFNEGRWR
jgi:hypothetical protein